MQIYTTRKVNNQVDFRIVSKIIEILRKKSIDDDYLQIFKIERNKIVINNETCKNVTSDSCRFNSYHLASGKNENSLVRKFKILQDFLY